MNGPPIQYKHQEWVAGHGDVLKHVVLLALITELQKEHPGGVMLVDCMAGAGVYDLNQHPRPASYQKGILRVLEAHAKDPENTPQAVSDFCQLLLQSTGCNSASDLDVYPGSPVFGQNVLRQGIDEHRVMDKYVEQVQWLNEETSQFKQADCFQSMEFILPYTDGGKHPIIFIDPDYQDESDFGQVKALVSEILDQHPYATVMVWMPLLQNHKFRWSYPSGLRETVAKKLAKSGRYFCSMNIAKDGYQGSAVLVCNPTRDFDQVAVTDEVVHWLANTVNMGKDEYMVEQTNKKVKS